MAGATERVEHVAECLPEICTLDCGTMNFAEADYVMTNTPGMLRAMGGMMTELGVKPGDRGLRHRPSLVRQATGRGRRDRRPACWCSSAWACRGARRTTSTPSWRWSTTCRRTGPSRPSRSAATRWPMSPRPCSPAAMSASGWRTISSSARASSPPMRSSSKSAVTIVERHGRAGDRAGRGAREAEADEAGAGGA